MDEYFNWKPWQDIVLEPFRVSDTVNRFRVVVKVIGGGVHSQAQAIRHGIARALVVYDENLKPPLRQKGFITRDARIKESKKYGLKRARRAPQYTKR
jgi:small subunit ribosomal protein S9